MSSDLIIQQATTADDLDAIKTCFRAYADWLGEDLSFQDFDTELVSLPGKYAAPTGALLLARERNSDGQGKTLGCIALRPLHLAPPYDTSFSFPGATTGEGETRTGELKRLYVDPAARGRGVAKSLVREAVRTARAAGYDVLLLDTLGEGKMGAALGLYLSEGFQRVAAYCVNPLGGVVYLGLRIRTSDGT